MIADAVIQALSAVLATLIGWIPEWTLPDFMGADAIADAFDWLRDGLGPVAYWVDFSVVFGAVAFWLLLRTSFFAFSVAARIINFIRGAGS